MRSIKTKLVILIAASVIVAAISVGGLGIYELRAASHSDSVRMVNSSCGEKSQEMNHAFVRTEQSVDVLAEYAKDNLESVEKLSQDEEYLEQYTARLAALGQTIAEETQGSVGVYVRFNPEKMPPTSGFYYAKDAATGAMKEMPVTDFSQYEKDELNWYYQPVQFGAPTWMNPYQSEADDVRVISYIVPLYKEAELVGVVGMDIDFSFIIEMTDEIRLYETGHAFLTNEQLEIVHSEHFADGTSIRTFSDVLAEVSLAHIDKHDDLYEYTYEGVDRKMAIRALENGMYLAVTVPVHEIVEQTDRLVLQMIVVVIAMVVAFIGITYIITSKIVNPIKELNDVAQEVARGNLDVTVNCETNDEVGMLASSLKETVKQLKMRMDYINNLAYTDKLTGIYNNTAFLQEVSHLKMEGKHEPFAVFLIDVNGLKLINDTYGHDYGNELLISASKVIVNVFGYENAYRIGGDEFAVLLHFADTEHCRRVIESLREKSFRLIYRFILRFIHREAPTESAGALVCA